MAKRGLSRKELEELKKREEIEAAAEVINNNCFWNMIYLYFILTLFLVLLSGVWGICSYISRRCQQSQQSLG